MLNLRTSHLVFLALFAASLTSARAEATDTLKKMRESGTVSMGVREASGVLSYSLGPGKFVGFHVEVCQQIIAGVQKELGLAKLDVNYVSVTNANRTPLLMNGTIDLECGSTSNTATRQRDVGFAPTLYVETVQMLVRANSGITSIEQLTGKTVTSTTGSVVVQTLRKHQRAANVSFKEIFARDNTEAFLLLESGRADAFVNDRQVLATLLANSRDPSAYRIVGESLSVEPIGIMIPRDDAAFKKLVDTRVQAMVSSGQIAKLYDKWFMQPIPPHNVAVNLPASDLTRAAWAQLNNRPMEDYARK